VRVESSAYTQIRETAAETFDETLP
jgi:hypothetical protein